MKYIKTYEMTPSTKQLIYNDINKYFLVKHKGKEYISKLIDIDMNRRYKNLPEYKFLIDDKNIFIDFFYIIRDVSDTELATIKYNL